MQKLYGFFAKGENMVVQNVCIDNKVKIKKPVFYSGRPKLRPKKTKDLGTWEARRRRCMMKELLQNYYKTINPKIDQEILSYIEQGCFVPFLHKAKLIDEEHFFVIMKYYKLKNRIMKSKGIKQFLQSSLKQQKGGGGRFLISDCAQSHEAEKCEKKWLQTVEYLSTHFIGAKTFHNILDEVLFANKNIYNALPLALILDYTKRLNYIAKELSIFWQ